MTISSRFLRRRREWEGGLVLELRKIKNRQRELFDIVMPYKIDGNSANGYFSRNKELIERSCREYIELDRRRRELIRKLGGREYRFSYL